MSGSQGTTTPSNDDLSTVRSGRRSAGYSGAVLAVVAVVLLLLGLGAGIAVQRYVLGGGSGTSSTVTISETGSSLIFPLFQLWAPAYHTLHPEANVVPTSTGSGTGISSAESGTTDIGGTDAYINGSVASQYHLLDIATAISAQLVFYNLPGVSGHLNLNGSVIAKIYGGAITKWNDPEIAAANPGVTLPDQSIIAIHRSDGSGDTYMFTQFCYLSWSGWPYGYGTSASFPTSGNVGTGQGNSGMVTTLQNTPYGIAYIGISYKTQATSAGLQYAALGDQAANVDGTNPANYILPTPQNISQDANLGLVNLQPPSLAISLILGGVPGAILLTKGGGGTMPTTANPTPYPIVNLENLLISTSPSSQSHMRDVVQFLEWSISYGQSNAQFMVPVNFLPLTPAVIGYDMLALQGVPISA
jgi:phosphate transport system substrate-binding protein